VLWVKLGDIIRAAGLGSFGEWRVSGRSFNPTARFGAGTTATIFLFVARVAGSALVVPPMEEVFFRSFLIATLPGPIFNPSRSANSFGRRSW